MNLLCLSSRDLGAAGGVEVPVDLAGKVALEAAADLSEGAALRGAAFVVGASSRVGALGCLAAPIMEDLAPYPPTTTPDSTTTPHLYPQTGRAC